MQDIQFQFFSTNSNIFIWWKYDLSKVKVNDIIVVKNDKQKINGYTEKFSNLIIRELANNSRYLFEYPDFVNFINKCKLSNFIKVTKSSFNSVPYFKFKVIDIYDGIIVIDPIETNW